MQPARTLDIDYNVYAAGEAALGWLNAGGVLTARQGFSPRNWVAYLLRMLDTSLAIHGAEIAHIKAYARTADADYKASLTQSHAPVSWDLSPDDRDCTVTAFRAQRTRASRIRGAGVSRTRRLR